jgi:hypothetical protein
MFGLDQSTQKVAPYDLEAELLGSDGAKRRQELKKLIQERTEWLKTLLRSGGSKEEFLDAENLLKGYQALSLVIDRIK